MSRIAHKKSYLVPALALTFACAAASAPARAQLVIKPLSGAPAAAPPAPAFEGLPEGAKVDAAAAEVIKKMAALYAAAKSYTGKLELRTTGLPDRLSATAELSFAKPNRFKIENIDASGTTRLVSDGTAVYHTVSRARGQFVKMAAPTGRLAIQAPLNEIGAGGSALALLLSGNNPLQPFKRSLRSLVFGAPDAAPNAGADTHVIVVEFVKGKDTGTVTYVIGKEDHLLRGVHLAQTTGGRAITVRESHSGVRLDGPVSDAAFTFEADGDQQVEAFPRLTYDPRLKVGGDPFLIEATDTNGNKVSLDDYKGKVVMIDFWASWCPPCHIDAPHVVNAYNTYKDDGFDILGVSLDYERAPVQQFVETKGMPWRQIFDGGGWQSEISTLYGIGSVPFTVIIGRDGKIACINPRGERQLAASISNAIEGRRTTEEDFIRTGNTIIIR